MEIAIALKEKGIIPEEILTDIAYLHYIKMKNSNMSPKYIEEHISKYPEIKGRIWIKTFYLFITFFTLFTISSVEILYFSNNSYPSPDSPNESSTPMISIGTG